MAIIMRNRLARLIVEVEELKDKKSPKLSVTPDSKNKIEEGISFLKENYNQDISREGLAETLGISHDYFGKVFKEYTGKTINDYTNDLRIQKAEKMLIESKNSVINIAFSKRAILTISSFLI